MIITKLQYDKAKKVKVFIDEKYSFSISVNETEGYQLKEGYPIDDLLYNKIIDEIVYPQAKVKALMILERSDKTEAELRHRLAQAGFANDVIKRVMDFLKSYGYINDERYAEAYIYANKQKKSRLAIRSGLLQKGIAPEIADKFLDLEYNDDEAVDYELEAIKKEVAKKASSTDILDDKKKHKLITALCRKGFELGKILKVIDFEHKEDI